MITIWYKHERVVGVGVFCGLGKNWRKHMGVDPSATFTQLKLPVQKRESPREGKSRDALSQLLRLYQILIDDLQFYILHSRPCRALESVSKNRGFKNINLYNANNSMGKGPAWF